MATSLLISRERNRATKAAIQMQKRRQNDGQSKGACQYWNWTLHLAIICTNLWQPSCQAIRMCGRTNECQFLQIQFLFILIQKHLIINLFYLHEIFYNKFFLPNCSNKCFYFNLKWIVKLLTSLVAVHNKFKINTKCHGDSFFLARLSSNEKDLKRRVWQLCQTGNSNLFVTRML